MPFARTLLPVAVAALALVAPVDAHAAPGQFTIFEAPRELASEDAALRTQTLDEIQGLGAEWIRVVLYWRDVAPAVNARSKPDGFDETQPAGYDWSRYDRVIGEARARGLEVLVTISGPVPTWATANRKGHTYKPQAIRFGRFASAVGRRYGDQVTHWSIWNEPNHPQFLTPQYRHGRPYSPSHYRRLYVAGRAGLRAAGQGGDRILAGETAPRGTSRVVAPVDFVEGFFCRGCAPISVGGWAHHPYTTRSGPFFRPPDRDDVTIGVLSRLTRALDRRARDGIPVYVTEFGIQSEPDPYVGVSESRQAEFRSLAERIAYRNRRVRSFSQYMMRDDTPRPGATTARYSGFESGLRHSGGQPKLAYHAFRTPLVALRGRRGVMLWGLVRPGHGVRVVEVQYRGRGARAWRRLKSDRTSAGGYWSTATRYRKGRTYRVLWNGLAGPPTRVYRGR